MRPSVSILVSAYNEASSLETVVNRCIQVLPDCANDYEIVMLDDASTDETPEIMERFHSRLGDRVRVLRHSVNQGIAATFEDLYQAAAKEFVFLIPGDNEYPPEVLREIMPMLDEYDIVVCPRSSKPYTAWRKLVSGAFRRLPRWLFGVELYDPGSIKCVRRTIITDIPIMSRGVFAEAERLIRAVRRGYKVGAVPIVQQPRQGGKARGARVSLVVRAMADLLKLWIFLIVLRRRP
jgi:glycosyltransferase involved in cell wall biosynthesis